MDFFVLMGPSPKDTIKQYASLTGVPILPQVSFDDWTKKFTKKVM